MAFALGEIGGLGLGGREDGLHLRPYGSVLDQGVEGLNGALNQHDHAHVLPPAPGFAFKPRAAQGRNIADSTGGSGEFIALVVASGDGRGRLCWGCELTGLMNLAVFFC